MIIAVAVKVTINVITQPNATAAPLLQSEHESESSPKAYTEILHRIN